MAVRMLLAPLLSALATPPELGTPQLASEQCKQLTGFPCLPGLDHIGGGFNVVTGVGTSLRPTAFTYDKKSTWTNPFDATLTFAYPDQMNVENSPQTLGSVVTQTVYSASEYGKKLSIDAGLGINGGGFSLSVDVNYANSFMQNRKEYFGFTLTTRMATIYKADMLPPFLLPLDPNFGKAVDYYLKGAYSQDNFDDFVNYFGTHYIRSATFGGKGEMKSAVSRRYSEAHYDSDLNIQAKAHYMWVSAHFGMNTSSHDASSNYVNTSTITSKLYGGDIGKGLEDWDSWYPTFWKNPVKITYELQAYDDIIADAGAKANFQRGYTRYLAMNPYAHAPACHQPGQSYCKNVCCEFGQTCAEQGGGACCQAGESNWCKVDDERVRCCPPVNTCCAGGCCQPGTRCGKWTSRGQYCLRENELGETISSSFVANDGTTYHNVTADNIEFV